MNFEQALQIAEETLRPWTQSASRPESNRLDLVIPAEHLLEAVAALQSVSWGYLSAIIGLDRPVAGSDPEDGVIESLYTFCEGSAILVLRVGVPYATPVVPSICGLIPSATIYEREMVEMYGLTITGTPDTSHLILPDDWPDGVYPLRKSYTGAELRDVQGA